MPIVSPPLNWIGHEAFDPVTVTVPVPPAPPTNELPVFSDEPSETATAPVPPSPTRSEELLYTVAAPERFKFAQAAYVAHCEGIYRVGYGRAAALGRPRGGPGQPPRRGQDDAGVIPAPRGG